MKRLLVVHRFPIVRYGLIKLAETHIPGVVVVESGTARLALRRVREENWDLVVIGLSFGDRSGLELLKAMRALRPNVHVLVFSTHTEEIYARRSFTAGAAGYVTKDSSRGEVVHAIQAAMSGVRYVSPRVSKGLAADPHVRRAHPPHRALSDRELELMRLLASGKTVAEIASLLALSVGAISTYRARLLHKLAMKNTAEVVGSAFA